jgi:hypothetical protein
VGRFRCYVIERRRVAFVARFIHNGVFGTLFTCFVKVNGTSSASFTWNPK